MYPYRYAIFDPRPVGMENNEKVFASGPVFGIEVTIAALAERCISNLDPQHTEGASRAAIEDALGVGLPPAGVVLATVRADLDSIGAMAVLTLRAEGKSLEPAMERIGLVAESDKFARGRWPGRRPLPTNVLLLRMKRARPASRRCDAASLLARAPLRPAGPLSPVEQTIRRLPGSR